ncbi:MAG: hypothetical protein IAC77_03500 [Proteobacteria bacterium]|uniref:Uncharacterized protein n=1 Tax=Candidatus Enterousia excrementavium TaxID=2840789 RepID=A0A940DE57_9PROT|nr:hypothetical protein [Candidatus Enterousia excrementavium]
MKSVFKKVLGGALAMLPTAAVANPACPICTIAIGAGVGVAESLGVPSVVVGIWAGALLTLLGYWMIKFFDKRGWKFWGRDVLLIGVSVAMIGFAYVGDLQYTPQEIWSVIYLDPILFGALLGMVVLIVVEKLYEWMKRKNGGHAHFPFERVVLPVVALALVSWGICYCF